MYVDVVDLFHDKSLAMPWLLDNICVAIFATS